MVASLSFRGPHLERRRDDRLPASGRVRILKCWVISQREDPVVKQSKVVFFSSSSFYPDGRHQIRTCFCVTLRMKFFCSVIVWMCSPARQSGHSLRRFFTVGQRTAHRIKLASSWSYTSTLAQSQTAEMPTSSAPQVWGGAELPTFGCFHRTNWLTRSRQLYSS